MSGPPAWLVGRLQRSFDRLDALPDSAAAVRAVARRHERDEADVLLTAGASEGLLLLERVLRPERAVSVDPHHELFPRVDDVPDDADLVLVGSPDAAGRVADVAHLCRPGRTVVVDEAYGDAVPGSYGDRVDLVVVRSLSRTWGLAGLRVGYLLAAPDLVRQLRAEQQRWPVSTMALTALETCLGRGPVRAAEKAAQEGRERLAVALEQLGVEVVPGSQAPYLLCRSVPAVGDSLPDGVRPQGGHWRIDVPDDLDRLVQELSDVLEGRSDP